MKSLFEEIEEFNFNNAAAIMSGRSGFRAAERLMRGAKKNGGSEANVFKTRPIFNASWAVSDLTFAPRRPKLQSGEGTLRVLFIRHAESENNVLYSKFASKTKFENARSVDPNLTPKGVLQVMRKITPIKKSMSSWSELTYISDPSPDPPKKQAEQVALLLKENPGLFQFKDTASP